MPRFDAQAAVERLIKQDQRPTLPFRIDRAGQWYYQDSIIKRIELIKLFSTALYCGSDGSHWLMTPFEQGEIEVEDSPFTIVQLKVKSADGKPAVIFRDNIERETILDEEHPLVMKEADRGQTIPYLTLDGKIMARLLPSVFYELVDLAIINDQEKAFIESCGCLIEIGSFR